MERKGKRRKEKKREEKRREVVTIIGIRGFGGDLEGMSRKECFVVW